jgi:hypothetical protein
MAQNVKGDLSQIVDSFAAAATDSTLWGNAMDVAAKITGSKGAFLLPVRGIYPRYLLATRSARLSSPTAVTAGTYATNAIAAYLY